MLVPAEGQLPLKTLSMSPNATIPRGDETLAFTYESPLLCLEVHCIGSNKYLKLQCSGS